MHGGYDFVMPAHTHFLAPAAPRHAAALLLLTLVVACTGTSGTPATAPLPAGGDTIGACETPTLPLDAIPAVQGRAAESPLVGRTVTVQGVVTGDFAGPAPSLGGVTLQALTGDGDPATSDALFVALAPSESAALGDVLRVRGVVAEVDGQTQLADATVVTRCTGGVRLTPTELTLPLPDDLEPFEAMLVRLPQVLSVTEHFQLGRFGQVVVSNGRLWQPTQRVAPGPEAVALAAANARNRLLVDDVTNAQNPDPIAFGRGGNPLAAANPLRAGDEIVNLTGVLTHTAGGHSSNGPAWRLRPISALGGGAPPFTARNARRDRPADVGGTLRVSAFNVLNYYNTFGRGTCSFGDGGAATDCRGAASAADFERQAAKIVAAIVALDAHILGVMEIENDGYGPTSALADLVTRLNAATAPGTYAFVDADTRTGTRNALGTDGIKVGLVYQPARVSLVGRTAVLATNSFVTGGDARPRNRPSLVQAFAQPDGATLVVSVNHLKSKGSACDAPDAGDGQGHCNVVRTNSARELARFLAGDPTGTGDPDVLLLGDLNAYAMEDPVRALVSLGFSDLEQVFGGDGAYSYLFDAQLGSLDHALASASLAPQVTGVTTWHINADEPPVLGYDTAFKSPAQRATLYAPDPFRSSDHDPVLVGLRLR
jgi:predicted extracellular nuclease